MGSGASTIGGHQTTQGQLPGCPSPVSPRGANSKTFIAPKHRPFSETRSLEKVLASCARIHRWSDDRRGGEATRSHSLDRSCGLGSRYPPCSRVSPASENSSSRSKALEHHFAEKPARRGCQTSRPGTGKMS